jgi:transmembrane sensor
MRKTPRRSVYRVKEFMMAANERRDEAIAWHVRLSGPQATAVDWDSFTDWLESDPANGDAYEAVLHEDAALSDSLSDAAFPSASADNDNEAVITPWYRRRRSLVGLSACVALAALTSPLLRPGRTFETIETKLGDVRDIALSDGSHITLNGGTTLLLDRREERFAQLKEGEAVFSIRHDAAHPFVIETRTGTLKDLGTVFNVRQDGDSLEIVVGEGAVQFNPESGGLTVPAGNKLQVGNPDAVPLLSKADPAMVAGWRQRQLSYHDVPLSTVALDLTRMLGTPVLVSSELATRHFTGLIRVERDQKQLFRRLEALLGVHAQHSANGWLLTS